MGADAKELRFLRSALTEESEFHSTEDVLTWLAGRERATSLRVEPAPLDNLGEWSFQGPGGDLVHRSGKFFRVHGIRVSTNTGAVAQWDQPIIDQPEIGILGIVVQEIHGLLYFLMQAKAEPGNIQSVQLTTTVQATKSNYTQVHQGSRPKYVEYFLEPGPAMLVDQLQFEQGSAFLRKRNRNMVVETHGGVPVEEDHIWVTLGQIKRLLTVPNLVSMDARTVLSCIPLIERGWRAGSPTGDLVRGSGEKRSAEKGLNGFQLAVLRSMAGWGPSWQDDDAVIGWLSTLKSRYQARVEPMGLGQMEGWSRGAFDISHDGGRYFHVMAVRVEANTREVVRWDQPLIRAAEKGLVAFIVKPIDGTLHVLVQGKVEPGNPDTVAIGPTVQCTMGSERMADRSTWPPFADTVLNAPAPAVHYQCTQSEEGGRFYHVENDYRIVEVAPDELTVVPDCYHWVTMRQLHELLRYGFVNVEARSLLACISLVDGPKLCPPDRSTHGDEG